MVALILPALSFVAGMVFLVLGGSWLVDGAVGIARRLGWPPLVIGLTIVAFGTSAPELAFNISASIGNHPDLTFGNVIGSNIANIGLVLGLGGIVSPLVVHNRVVRREVPQLIAVTGVATALIWAPWSLVGGSGGFGRHDGVVMLVAFVGLLIAWYRFGQSGDGGHTPDGTGSIVKATMLATSGLAALVGGGALAEDGAVQIAQELHISEAVIGLTIVALATSLPELVTVIIACRKGHTDVAVGNVVGSNLFNLLLVMAVSATIRPIPLPDGAVIDLVAMGALTLVLLPFCITNNSTVNRWESIVLLAGYATWMAVRLVRM